jgi:hypothetical protein
MTGGIILDEITKEALKGSIEKWKKIESGLGIDQGQDNCPLCQLFCKRFGCDKCPVNLKSHHACGGTPYFKWSEHFEKAHGITNNYQIQEGCMKCRVLAGKELDYLKSLLPQDERSHYPAMNGKPSAAGHDAEG